jgi:hypothetical protein
LKRLEEKTYNDPDLESVASLPSSSGGVLLALFQQSKMVQHCLGQADLRWSGINQSNPNRGHYSKEFRDSELATHNNLSNDS